MLSPISHLLCLLLAVGAIIAWLLESRQDRIHRLHCSGWSQRRIASHLGITRYQVRKALS